MRKSSVHFKQVANASVSIAHSTRTEETEPAYLLPKEHRLSNVIVPGSMSNIDLGLEFTRAKASMTGQAKARGSSPFWEGVVVLDGTDFKAQTAALQSWKKEYEKSTGQRVLHMAIHGDEGFINSSGKPEYNIHAHVIVNRLNDKGRVIKLERKQLSAVQDLTAKSLGMQRGETLEDRKGMRGRKHLNHREFKAQANEKRLDAEHNIGAIQKSKASSDNFRDLFKSGKKIIDDLRDQVDGEPARLAAALAAQEEKYRLDREALKASGTAKQADYQALKKANEEEIATLKTQLKTAQVEAAKVPALETKITQLEADKAQLATEAAKATEYQAAKAQGTPAHLIVPGTTPAPVIGPNERARLRALEAAKTASEAPKLPEVPTPSPKPAKSLVERLGDSMRAMLDWIKSIGGEQEPITANSRHDGPVKHLDDLHCIQKTGYRYAVHRLDDLDKVPALDDPRMVIQYKDGKGTVEGKTGPGVQR